MRSKRLGRPGQPAVRPRVRRRATDNPLQVVAPHLFGREVFAWPLV